MKNKRLETAATVILAVVCAALIFHLAVRVRSVDAGAPPVPPANSTAGARRAVLELPSRRGMAAFPAAPVLNVTLYRELQSQTIASPDRDPFSFQPSEAQLQQAIRNRAAAQAASAVSSAPPPPPPPPLPFKAVGYSVQSQGQIQAYLADSDQIYVLVEGQLFDKSYRVLRITPALIEIEDDLYHRTVELPFPQ